MTCLDRSTTPRIVPRETGPGLWARIRAVDDFALCDGLDLIRVFPRLLPRDGRVPAAIQGQITRCLAVLAWRSASRGDEVTLRRLGDATDLALGSLLALGRRDYPRWYGGDEVSPAGASVSPDFVDEVACFALLAALRREIAAGALRPFAADDAALVAYAAGVHPAYLWAEALLSHETFTAVGWLGQLRRLGRAAMPADVAEFFEDVIDDGPGGAPRLRDRDLARFLPPGLPAALRQGVRAHRAGLEATVCWPDGSAASPVEAARAEA